MAIEARRAGGSKKKNTPPILSHEFVIQNHGDIASCVLMLVIVGLMFPSTAPLSAIFVVPQYNETVKVQSDTTGLFETTIYGIGMRDILTITFYAVAWVTVHAILQEYIFDKLRRKINLSKAKQFKFPESGHHLFFAIYSVVHAGYVVHDFIRDYKDVVNIWAGYPQQHFMNLNQKLFFLIQISYWLHWFPEFYFAKMKKEEMHHFTVRSFLHITYIAAAYVMRFHRLATVLLAVHYSSDVVFHSARLVHYFEKKNVAKSAFKFFNLVFLVARVLTAALAVVTFWYGLRQSGVPYIDFDNGNFNTSFVRVNSMIAILIMQLYMTYQFGTFHFGRIRDHRQRKQKKNEEKKHTLTPKKRESTRTESESSAHEQSRSEEKQAPRQRKAKAH